MLMKFASRKPEPHWVHRTDNRVITGTQKYCVGYIVTLLSHEHTSTYCILQYETARQPYSTVQYTYCIHRVLYSTTVFIKYWVYKSKL